MATKADFDEQEWDGIHKGVTGAGILVSLSDRDFTDSFGEANALAKYLANQRSTSDSTLVRDIASGHRSGFGFRTSYQELESDTLDALRSAVATLTAKAPDELPAYRQLVLGAAHTVADAKGGGTSNEEQAAIDKIAQALGGS
jgi:hypothetical protein